MIVLAWLLDDQWVYQSIIEGISNLQIEVKSVTLICHKTNLLRRWKNDRDCEWRTDEWLEVSLKSLPYFSSLGNSIDTSGLHIDKIADMILL